MALVLDGSTGIVSANIADGTISASDLASGAITSAALPAGSVIQVVHTSYPASWQSPNDTSWGYTSGLDTSITTQGNSKILIETILSDGQGGGSSTNGIYIQQYLNGAAICGAFNEFDNSSGYSLRQIPITYMSGVLSAGTYNLTTFIRSNVNGAFFRYNWVQFGASTVVITEIVA